MKVKVEGVHNPLHAESVHSPVHSQTVGMPAEPVAEPLASEDHHVAGPRPIGTLMVIAILLLVTIAFWMMVLGIQQGRA